MKKQEKLQDQIDWFSMIVPLCIVIILIQAVRGFLGDEGGIYYAVLGLGIFLCTMYMAFSRYGSIRLGKETEVEYTSF